MKFTFSASLIEHYKHNHGTEIEERVEELPRWYVELPILERPWWEGPNNKISLCELVEPDTPRKVQYLYMEGMFYMSPDLATGERGLCTE